MKTNMNRREWLKSSVSIAAAAVAAPLLFSPLAEASTSGLSSKSSVSYQDHPSGNDMCSNCTHFVPGASPDAMGTCKVVAGKISPHGYCYAYTPISS
jgi:anaerobic selenocysteine-containing dehydrogenase